MSIEAQDNQQPIAANDTGVMEDPISRNSPSVPSAASITNPSNPPTRSLPLPDLIQCSQIQANASIQCTMTSISTNTTHDDSCDELEDDVYDSQDFPSDDWSLDFGVKLEFGAYRRCGQELRTIADNFRLQVCITWLLIFIISYSRLVVSCIHSLLESSSESMWNHRAKNRKGRLSNLDSHSK